MGFVGATSTLTGASVGGTYPLVGIVGFVGVEGL